MCLYPLHVPRTFEEDTTHVAVIICLCHELQHPLQPTLVADDEGSPVRLSSGYSPIIYGSHGCLLCIEELARRDMVLRVGEGKGAVLTKGEEMEEEEEVGRQLLRLRRQCALSGR